MLSLGTSIERASVEVSAAGRLFMMIFGAKFKTAYYLCRKGNLMEKRIEPSDSFTLSDRVMIGEAAGMSIDELLAVIAGSDDAGTVKRLLGSCDGNIASLTGLGGDDVAKRGRLGKRQSVAVAAAIELASRMEPSARELPQEIKTNADVIALFEYEMRHKRQEELWVLYLTGGNRLIERRCISIGGASGVTSDIKIVVGRAIALLAAGVIAVHNHPSGDSYPSDEDIELTSRLKQACSLFDIRLLDHIIIGDRDHYSFLQRGCL